MNDQSNNDDFFVAVTYRQVSSVFKQCDKATSKSHETSSTLSGNSGSTTTGNRNENIGNGNVNDNSTNSKSNAICRYLCIICKNFGPWKQLNNCDGSLPPEITVFNGNFYTQWVFKH